MKATLFAGLLLFIQSVATASLLELKAGEKTLEKTNIASQATTTLGTQTFDLFPLGAGVRSKKVLVANFKVYVAQLLATQTEQFNRDPNLALSSTQGMQTVAIHLTFVRNVEADKIQMAFRDSFQANEVDANDPSLTAFLADVASGGDAHTGEHLTIVVTQNSSGTDSIYYEDTLGKVSVVEGPRGLAQKILSIYLGNPADEGLESLKKQILNSK